MTEPSVKRPARQLCPRCSTEDRVSVETLGPMLWRYTCARSCRQHAEAFSWDGKTPDGPIDVEQTYNKAEDLGLPNDLLVCLNAGDPFVEYGVVEYTYATSVNPKVYADLVKDYVHTALAPKQYTASAFIASTLGRMQKEGSLAYRSGPATGFWAYNGVISYWSLLPTSDQEPRTFSEFAAGVGFDAQTWPPLAK